MAAMSATGARAGLHILSILLLLQSIQAQLTTSTVPASSASATSGLPSTLTSATNRPLSTTVAPSSTTDNSSSTQTVSQAFTPTSSPTPSNFRSPFDANASRYYPIIGVVIALVLAFIAFRVIKKKRREAAAARLRNIHPYVPAASRQPYARALRRDRNPPSMGMPEGVDERGEAPPPYGVGSKPPSISAGYTGYHQTEDVEMGRMHRSADDGAPAYYDAGDIGNVTRPVPAASRN
ncbi:hypothetical protein PVAG01_02631 [Phlyctema vagabunda]|uniref:Transmembrane protein n=1 Tax=Phlyctema vagabunda TaxID=108571 RepID=A0ABR4PRF3_9HELO